MRYISTRGEAPVLAFSDALLAGLARDGGLYVPETFPALAPADIARLAGRPYAEAACKVITPFVDEVFTPEVLRPMLDEAYASFRHPATTPLVQIAPNRFVLELFHGPTLAFKDVAMQLLGRMMDHVLTQRDQRATIVGATSGDTGSAAIEAFRGRARTDVFILYPAGRVSEVQRRQMTTVPDANVHAIAVEGTFDDCQAHVKGMFNHHAFRDRLRLAGVNSINWARIVAQVVYYFVAGAALGAPHRPVSFVVPTGNFGDVLAGFVAKRMGLTVDRLVIATNVNDILARTLASGRYEVTGVVPSSSPSMDIQVSSNFERVLFEALDRDAGALRGLMAALNQSGAFSPSNRALEAIRADFDAGRTDEAQTAETIARVRRETSYLLDPHSAVAVSVAERIQHDPRVPQVVLSTAHPAKFPDAVERACGERPALPPHLADLMEREERTPTLPNDIAAIEAYISRHARAAEPAL
ncbi:threonine synthase [Ancylobacter novellus DSM 506]|uniref:Threonine synthase n=1 Tax=Ancylobacter novellus (strain ATCC 8093 / DSM 506 / JCM 20403 / CCM 1077 / IAM 12100 / NBRC 12443 / NCIMB 10456) TaxID=639283 RepID=D7A4A5_ANCN5|nr:threonine synthase [Ancylobacter novellus]ADH87925.1 threonine synthase [Ancylobacter novellus DSM 506]